MKGDLQIIEITQESMESMIYEIRGQKVMLDFDLARIYGYETKRFNEQVKNNIEKFPDDMMFCLTDSETKHILRSKKSTANELSSKRRYNPYAFTEQGIYMLMTVLKGEIATKQSLALIRLFKQMKDYITENSLIGYNEIIKLIKKVETHDRKIKKVNDKLEVVMDYFIDPTMYKHFLILNGERFEAIDAYEKIYSLAKQSIIIIDDYISVKTLKLLRNINKNIDITIFSDNIAKDFIRDEEIDIFEKEYGKKIIILPTNNRFHDRYIIIDYKENNEKLYNCGSSSKDAGNKITTITLIEKPELYHQLIDELLNQKEKK